MNETQRREREEDLKAEAKATLADFLDHQQRALAAAGKACEAPGPQERASYLRVAGATSLAGFRILVRNLAEVAAECEEAGLCGESGGGKSTQRAAGA